MKLILVAISSALILSACTTSGSGHAVAVPAATEQQQAQLLGQVQTLAGTWEMTDEKGARQVATTFSVSSSGSVVREVMFPGQSTEMTNIYHMDGPTLVMTHYCAIGNQPRMRAAAADKPGIIDFRFDSVTNLHKAQDHYMGQMRLTILDADHIKEEWFAFTDGKLTGPTTFDLTRKR